VQVPERCPHCGSRNWSYLSLNEISCLYCGYCQPAYKEKVVIIEEEDEEVEQRILEEIRAFIKGGLSIE
jgi:uncharacterized Zn finger protein (UPF0148 family)